jgi:hypothetical protein
MAQVERTFRVFVSSTFEDMEVERNILHTDVFPRLRRLCARHGTRFQAIDLRWGVSGEASFDQRAATISLQEVRRCQELSRRPNFIALLGDRYGWRPLPPEIPAAHFDQLADLLPDSRELMGAWYVRDDNADPAVYWLRPRRGALRDKHAWAEVERRLQARFAWAAPRIDAPKDACLRYLASLTEQEIHLGALSVPDAAEHVLAFHRTIVGLPEDWRADPFRDFGPGGLPDLAASARQRDLKACVKAHLSARVHEYEEEWMPDGQPTCRRIGDLPADLDACLRLLDEPEGSSTLCVDAWRGLAKVILAEVAELEQSGPVAREVAAHRSFIDQPTTRFTGRAEALTTIAAHLTASDPDAGRQPLGVVGPSGSGKSALLAEAARAADADAARAAAAGLPPPEVLVRFIGATPESSDPPMLLSRVCEEISRRFGAAALAVPPDWDALVAEFHRRLALASPERPLLLFLDGLDQLSDANGAHHLQWLPGRLPAGVHLVVSTAPGRCADALQARRPMPPILELAPMSVPEGDQLLRSWLAAVNRTLQPEQHGAVLAAFAGEGSPLYLKLAFEEARHWRSAADTRQPKLARSVQGIIRDNLLRRLSEDAEHGAWLVARTLAFLAAARSGLAEDELLDVLSRDEQVVKELQDRAFHPVPDRELHPVPDPELPAAVWARLYADLAPYLVRRAVDGAALLTFHHTQFAEAVATAYLAGGDAPARHRELAAYFADEKRGLIAEPHAPDLRKLSELPFQQALSGGDRSDLQRTLTDLDFIDEKCSAGLVYDLMADYERVSLGEEADRYASFVRRHAQRLAAYPGSFFTLVQHEGFPAAREAARTLVRQGRWRKPWLRTTRPWMPPPGRAGGGLAVRFRSSCLFGYTSAADLAARRRLVFHVRRLGEIGALRLEDGQPLPFLIPTRREPVLAVASSPAGQYLAVAYDNGRADLLRLSYDADGALIGQQALLEFDYLLPELERPVVWLDDHLLIYQDAAGSLVSLVPGAAGAAAPATPRPVQTLRGELSGIVRSAAATVTTARLAGTTSVLAIRDGQIVAARHHEADVTALCPAGTGNEQVAIAFTDRSLVVLDASDLAVTHQERLDQLPMRMAATAGRLLWISEIEEVHLLELDDPATGPSRLEAPGPRFSGALRLASLADGSFAVVDSTGAFTFTVDQGDGGIERTDPLHVVFRTAADDGYVAVQERNGATWAIDARTEPGADVLLARRPPSWFSFGLHAGGRVLGAGEGGHVLADLSRRSAVPPPRLPAHIVSVAGSPHRGFWLADARGGIFRAADGNSRHVHTNRFEIVEQPSIRCWQGLVAWTACCLNPYDAVWVITLLRCDATGDVRTAPATRWFSVDDGRLAALTYDSARDRLWVVWERAGGLTVQAGTPEAFAHGGEHRREITDVDRVVTAATLACGGSGLVLLCRSGNLFYLDSDTLRVRVVLAPTVPLTAVAGDGWTPAQSILAVQGRTALVRCHLEGGAP